MVGELGNDPVAGTLVVTDSAMLEKLEKDASVEVDEGGFPIKLARLENAPNVDTDVKDCPAELE